MTEGGKLEDFHIDDREVGPTGPGYIVTLTGYHYYNSPDVKEYEKLGVNFVEDTLAANLREWTLDDGNGKITAVGQLGISHPIVVDHDDITQIYDPNARLGGAGGAAGGMGGMGGSYGGEYDDGAGMGGAGKGSMGGMGGPSMDGGGLSGSGYGSPTMGSGGPSMGGMKGGPSMPGGSEGGYSGGQLPSALTPLEGSVEQKDERKEVLVTTFVVQFAWVPVAEADRQESPATKGEQPVTE